MVRGVDVACDPMRLARMKSWFIEEKMSEWHKTMLIVAACRDATNSTDLSDLARKYRESLFPSGKTNEELIARYKEVLDSQTGKPLEVRALEK